MTSRLLLQVIRLKNVMKNKEEIELFLGEKKYKNPDIVYEVAEKIMMIFFLLAKKNDKEIELHLKCESPSNQKAFIKIFKLDISELKYDKKIIKKLSSDMQTNSDVLQVKVLKEDLSKIIKELNLLFPMFSKEIIVDVLKYCNYDKKMSQNRLLTLMIKGASMNWLPVQKKSLQMTLATDVDSNNEILNEPCSSSNQIRKTRNKALLVGINYYSKECMRLNGCIEDVKLMRCLLTEYYDFEDTYDTMLILTDAQDKLSENDTDIEFTNSTHRPTKKNILAAINWLIKDAEPGDFLFFHYSGHCTQNIDLKCQESDCMNEVLLPVDFEDKGGIEDDYLFNNLVLPLKENVHLTCLFDCCHSGTALDLPFIWNVKEKRWTRDTQLYTPSADVKLFSSCLDDELASDEYFIKGLSFGSMTAAVGFLLSKKPYGYTYDELLSDIQNRLLSRNINQTIQLSSSKMFDMINPFSFSNVYDVKDLSLEKKIKLKRNSECNLKNFTKIVYL